MHALRKANDEPASILMLFVPGVSRHRYTRTTLGDALVSENQPGTSAAPTPGSPIEDPRPAPQEA